MRIIHIKNALIANKNLQKRDILVVNNEIVKIAPTITTHSLKDLQIAEITTIDAKKQIAIPGLIDGHAHVLGAAGESGYETRAHEIPIKAFLGAGITTVIGLLGVDSLTRSPKALCAKIRALEKEGLTAFMLTGSYHLPARTITESCKSDIYLFPDIIGVGEIAISDRRSSQPSVLELQRLIKESLLGANAKGKKATIVFHCGNESAGAKVIEEVLKETDIDPQSLIVTHINRNTTLLKQAKRITKLGCYVDLTSLYFNNERLFFSPEKGLIKLLQAGVPLEQIIISSDSGCYIEKQTLTQPYWLYKAFYNIIQQKILTLQEAIQLFSTNTANAYGLTQKGALQEGKDADIVLLDSKYEIQTVIAKGKVMVLNQNVLAKDFTNGQNYITV